jgi:hypothetical protein
MQIVPLFELPEAELQEGEKFTLRGVKAMQFRFGEAPPGMTCGTCRDFVQRTKQKGPAEDPYLAGGCVTYGPNLSRGWKPTAHGCALWTIEQGDVGTMAKDGE